MTSMLNQLDNDKMTSMFDNSVDRMTSMLNTKDNDKMTTLFNNPIATIITDIIAKTSIGRQSLLQ